MNIVRKLKRSISTKCCICNEDYKQKNEPPACDCGKKCFITKRYIHVKQVWACSKCEVQIQNKHGSIKVRDYCHITGKYKGLVHQKCNKF